MGTWTWLQRISADDAAELLADPNPTERAYAICAGIDPSIRPVEEIHTHRAWHALHVVLTGREIGGEPPASFVIEDGTIRFDPEEEPPETTLLPPPDVRMVADFLATVPFADRLAEHYPSMRSGELTVYSFHDRDGQDMVECGWLRRVFDDVGRFYQAAAEAGDAVLKHRG